jgi:hypothetical protein
MSYFSLSRKIGVQIDRLNCDEEFNASFKIRTPCIRLKLVGSKSIASTESHFAPGRKQGRHQQFPMSAIFRELPRHKLGRLDPLAVKSSSTCVTFLIVGYGYQNDSGR